MHAQEAETTPKKSDLKFFVLSVGITAPAHQRRRATAQPVVNDAEQGRTWVMRRAVALPQTLHPFTTG